MVGCFKMADEETLRLAFTKLRPLCVELSRSLSSDDVESLHQTLIKLDKNAVHELQEYVMFPLRLIIKQSKSSTEKLYMKSIDSMTYVLSCGTVNQWSGFSDNLSSLCCLVSVPTPELSVAPVSEELKLSVLRCLVELLSHANFEILQVLYTEGNLPLIGHVVSILLAIAQTESNRKLKLLALRCLQILLVTNKYYRKISEDFSTYVSSVPEPDESKNENHDRTLSDNIKIVSNQECVFCNKEVVISGDSLNATTRSHVETSQYTPSFHLYNKEEQLCEILFSSSKIFASFLPGILTACTKMITGDIKQGQNLICAAVNVFMCVVTLVLSDEFLQMESKAQNENKDTADKNNSTGVKSSRLMITRIDDWVKSTADKLKILLDRIVDTGFDDNWKIRLSVVRMAAHVLMNYSSSLQNCTTQFLSVLVRGTTDDYKCVSRCAQQGLNEFRMSRLNDETGRTMDILKECVYNLSSTLPQQMSSASTDDNKKLRTLCLLKGYLKLLGPQLTQVLLSGAHLKRLSGSLIQVLQYDCSIIQLLGERTSGFSLGTLSDSHSVMAYRPRYHYRHFVDLRVEQEILSLCSLLGQHGDLEILIDNFLDLLHQSAEYRKQAVFCLNGIMSGMAVRAGTVCESCKSNGSDSSSVPELYEILVRLLVDEYIASLSLTEYSVISSSSSSSSNDPTTRSLSIIPSHDSHESSHVTSHVTIEQKNSQIILRCLLLDGLGLCARVMGAGFSYILADALYPLLAMLGSDNARVSQCALLALHDAARADGCASVGDLLCNNCDYVINSVSLKLRQVQLHPECLIVLSVLLRYGNTDVLPLVHDTMYEIMEALDLHYGDTLLEFLRVFHSLVSSVFTWYSCEHSTESNSSCSVPSYCESSVQSSAVTPSYELSTTEAENFNNQTNKSVGSWSTKDDTNIQTDKCTGYSSTKNGANCEVNRLESKCDDTLAESKQEFTKNSLSCEIRDRSESTMDDIVNYIQEYHENRLCAEGLADSVTVNDDINMDDFVNDKKVCDDFKSEENMEETEEEEKKESPLHVKLVTQVLDRCQHLMISNDTRVQLLILEIISKSCYILKAFQDELLPLLHKLWKPFIQKFSSSDHVVIVKAFNVLKDMGSCGGDFLYKRVITDVIPKVSHHLEKLSKSSLRKDSSYRHTALCKLQLSVLNNIGSVCRSVTMDVKQLNNLMHACLPYLSAQQPSCLQQACMDAFSEFIRIDADNVWLLMYDVGRAADPLITSRNIQVGGASRPNEFSHNVEKLMNLM